MSTQIFKQIFIHAFMYEIGSSLPIIVRSFYTKWPGENTIRFWK